MKNKPTWDSPRNFPDSQVFWEFQIQKFPKWLDTCRTLLMSGYLGNFLKYLDIWEISYNWKINTLRFSKEFGELPRFRYLWNFPEYQFLVNYPDFPNAWVFGKFPKCFQRKFPIAVVFRKFPYTWVFGKFLRFYKFLLESDDGVFVQFVEISRMLNCLGNFPNAWVLGKFTKCLVFFGNSQFFFWNSSYFFYSCWNLIMVYL